MDTKIITLPCGCTYLAGGSAHLTYRNLCDAAQQILSTHYMYLDAYRVSFEFYPCRGSSDSYREYTASLDRFMKHFSDQQPVLGITLTR